MRINTRLLSLVSGFAAVLGLFVSLNSIERVAASGSATALPVPTPTVGSTNSIKVTASSGLRIVTYEAKSGRVLLVLPDDMRAGDTISGTITSEPTGQTEDERAKNLEVLNGYDITLWPHPAPKPPGLGVFRLPVKVQSFIIKLPPPSFDSPPREPVFTGFNTTLGPPIAQGTGNVGAADNFPGIGSVVSGILPGVVLATTSMPLTLPPTTVPVVPQWGQQGRPIEIHGPFDGSFDNTSVRFGPPGSTVQDFEKNTENVSGGFGLIKPLAESPRKIVVQGPSNVDGPIHVFVKEGDTKTTGPHRNVSVRLTAPKTNLLRGERTTVTIEVGGLQGIQNDVPLQLDSKGVITMEGGSFQNLWIKPKELTRDGRYNTTREITGVQSGGFNVTATVIVRRFDFVLQDDADPNRLFHFNSFTGDYVFACGGGSCSKPGGVGGTSQTGGATGKPGGAPAPPIAPGGGGVNLTGMGRPTMKGCIITLSHNAPDRRVFARLDACTKTGDANVQTTSPKAEFNITDKNTSDTTASSTPPK